MGKQKSSPNNCSTAAYIYALTGQLAEMAKRDNHPTLAHILHMAQQEAAEAGLKPQRDRLNS